MSLAHYFSIQFAIKYYLESPNLYHVLSAVINQN